jgi:hypothetical protein
MTRSTRKLTKRPELRFARGYSPDETGAPHLGINAPRQPTFLRLATRADDSSEDGQRNLFIGSEK